MKLPESVMPVVEILRRDVPRPTARIVGGCQGGMGWLAPRFECGKCPMGLHPTALSKTPAIPEGFLAGSALGELNDYKNSLTRGTPPGGLFCEWWDALTLEEAEQARDLIWPKEVV